MSGAIDLTNTASVLSVDQPDDNPDNDVASAQLTATGILGDLAFIDVDQNGLFGQADVGAAGVSVILYLDDGDGVAEPNADDLPVVSTTTSEDGAYGFMVLPGDYFLEFIDPQQRAFTSQDVGDDDLADSDANEETGLTEVFSFPVGEDEDPSRDAGSPADARDVGRSRVCRRQSQRPSGRERCRCRGRRCQPIRG